MQVYKKPPLGLRPKWISDLQRLREIQAALVRYYEAEHTIPIEWVEEYNVLIVTTDCTRRGIAMKCHVCGGCGLVHPKRYPIADVCANCHGTGIIDPPDILEGCCGVVKGYKADTDE